MEVRRLTQATPQIAAGIGELLPQLSQAAPQTLAINELLEILKCDCAHLFVAEAGERVAGMLTLILAPVPTGLHGYIEDVVVDREFRSHGIAEKLVCAALDAARQAGATRVDLTSNPAREAANRLYVRLGFERRQTNVYRLTL